jgi:minor fimbrial subunit
MNIKKLLLFTYCLLGSPLVFAVNGPDPVLRVNLEFTAVIVDPTCVVRNDSQNILVNLNVWDTGSIVRAGDRTRAIPFSIYLSDCEADTVAVSFVGPQDQNDTNLLALNNSSTAQGVAVEILDKDRQQIPINEYSLPESVNNNATTDIKLDFFANYVATNDRVTAGRAHATATFKIDYN